MEIFCVSCKNMLLANIQVLQKLIKIDLSICAICGKKKQTFIKNKELHNFDD